MKRCTVIEVADRNGDATRFFILGKRLKCNDVSGSMRVTHSTLAV